MVDTFAEKAQGWDDKPHRIAMAQKFVDEVQKHIFIDNTSKVLDFGCGTGLVGLSYANTAGSVVMVDTSPAMLEVLQKKVEANRFTNVQILQGEIEKTRIQPASVDVVVSLMAFHHIDNLPEVLHYIKQILKPTGCIAVGDLVKEDGSFHGGETVAHHGFDLQELTQLFAESGFLVRKATVYNTFYRKTETDEEKGYDQFVLIAGVKMQ